MGQGISGQKGGPKMVLIVWDGVSEVMSGPGKDRLKVVWAKADAWQQAAPGREQEKGTTNALPRTKRIP